MRLLVIDTTGPACSAALRLPGRPDRSRSEEMVRGQAERLAPMVAELLADGGIAPGDLDRIGVAVGPGSFAGSRIGVAFARGLALATGAECAGVSNLEAWVRASGPQDGHPVIAAHDAKRGDVVVQEFESGRPVSAPETLSIDAFRQRIGAAAKNRPLSLVGSAAPLARGEITAPGPTPVDLTVLLDLAAGATPPFDPPRPFYARPPDAKLPGGRSLT